MMAERFDSNTFLKLLENTRKKLLKEMKNKPFKSASNFERRVREVISDELHLIDDPVSVNFNSHSQAFPDICLEKFGIEVKYTEKNTWRGIASSAEGMGEYFAFVILLYFLLFFKKIITINNLDFILLFINLLGLIRTNNFAAISSMTFLLILFYILNNSKNSKKILIYFILLCVVISSFGVYIYDEFSFQYLSNSVIYEGVQASEMNYEFKKNQYGQSDKKLGNYSLILDLPEDSTNMSSSLRFMVENYTNSYNIPYLPSINSMFNTVAYFINRSEKWGIFLAKYNPNLQEFLFGYGPQQLTHYYFDHGTKYNYGLFLPHSSLFNYLIFFGMLGLLLMFIGIFVIFRNKFNSVYFFLVIFLWHTV